MVIIIDNYDSFSYNLYQLIGTINPNVKVIRNDAMDLKELESLNPSHIVVSPGPGRPKDAGISESAIIHFKDKCPILGVCLGHQAICEVFGGVVGYAKEVIHGKSCNVHIANGSNLFQGLPPIMQVARYHSLAAERKTLPDELLIIAEDDNDEIMGLKHRDHEIYGVQFHPESIMTPQGDIIIRNFLAIEGNSK